MYMTLRMLTLCFFLGVLIPVKPMWAQTRKHTMPPPCGGFNRVMAEFNLKHYRDLFFSEAAADRRERRGLKELAPNAIVEVVDRPNECNRVMRAAVDILNTRIFEIDHPSERIKRNSIAWVILRYGPYYVVRITEPVEPNDGIAFSGFDSILIFRVDDLSFVNSFLG